MTILRQHSRRGRLSTTIHSLAQHAKTATLPAQQEPSQRPGDPPPEADEAFPFRYFPRWPGTYLRPRDRPKARCPLGPCSHRPVKLACSARWRHACLEMPREMEPGDIALSMKPNRSSSRLISTLRAVARTLLRDFRLSLPQCIDAITDAAYGDPCTDEPEQRSALVRLVDG